MEACIIDKLNGPMNTMVYNKRKKISKREQIKIISQMLDRLSFLPDGCMDVNDLELSINIKASGYNDRKMLYNDIKSALNLNSDSIYNIYTTRTQFYIRKK